MQTNVRLHLFCVCLSSASSLRQNDADNTGQDRGRGVRYFVLSCTVPGPGSSVGIATDYGLDGPGSNPSGDEIFRPSRPALGSTHPPVQ